MKILYIVCCALFFSPCSEAAQALNKLYAMSSSAISLVDSHQQQILSQRANEKFIPASTVKLITALAALEHWGSEYRFKTEFYLQSNDNLLIVRGLGDPFLVSEEIDLIVNRLKQMGISYLDGIIADTRYFDALVNIKQQGRSNNPYDAPSSALAVNFNSIELLIAKGKVSSGEMQTPLTPMAEQLAINLPVGKHRINLGLAERSPQYFVEVLTAKLNQSGINVGEKRHRRFDFQDADLLFEYVNTRSLEYVIKAMLEYSNNFIANQLFLLLGAEKYGPPANLQKSQQAISEYLDSEFSWEHYVLLDGAGLSRDNRLSANQLIDVLEKFKPYRYLLPQQSPYIFAKSGTLKGVSCYAGYVYRDNQWQSFSIMINQPVSYGFRERVADDLWQYSEH